MDGHHHTSGCGPCEIASLCWVFRRVVSQYEGILESSSILNNHATSLFEAQLVKKVGLEARVVIQGEQIEKLTTKYSIEIQMI